MPPLSRARAGARNRGRTWFVLLCGGIAAATAVGACASLTGLTGGDAGADAGHDAPTKLSFPDVASPHDAGRVDSTSIGARHDAAADAGSDAHHDTVDAGREAATCVPVPTTAVTIGDGGSCAIPDGSLDGACYAQPVHPAGLAWVPPHPHESACTTTELTALGTIPNPTLSTLCKSCLFSLTSASQYAAEVDFPQVTFTGYGFANVPGCIATLEPCNQPCAALLEQADLCSSEACLPSCNPRSDPTYSAFAVCVSGAENGCPCGAIASAANACFQAILQRNSPAAACIGVQVQGETQEQAYLAELEGVATALCAMVDGG